jgi:leucyl-tRNA synthetase
MSLNQYSHLEVEKKLIEKWISKEVYKIPNLKQEDKKKYILDAFAYPSGLNLHVGHAEGYSATDIVARFYRLKGYKVLYPTGWDAFGLPAENFAIKTGVHPRINTDKSIKAYKEQVKRLGVSSDWNYEIATHNPEYYKFTQWFFSLLYKKGLAYKKEALVNWDPIDQTVLANEQVLPDGTAERSGAVVEQRLMNQWFFKITDYADRLLNDLDEVDWPESTKIMQRNWIGKSVGININYPIENEDIVITVYTTRPDTNFGASFIVVAPDCKWVVENFNKFKYQNECQEYINKTKLKTALERISEGKVKTGAFTGLYAINRLNNDKLPIYLSDFVLSDVGTGAVIGVPGHDERDFEFAIEKNLPIKRVVVGKDGDKSDITKKEQVQEKEGVMINSGFLDGLEIMEAKEKIKDYIEEQGFGKRVINYKLRDWLVSRQRFWGSPIPVVYEDKTKEILLLTTNQGKINHIKRCLKNLNVKIKTLADLDYKIEEPNEVGNNVIEIAENKARYYYDNLKEKIPVLCTDHGMELFDIDESDNPKHQIKQRVLDKYGLLNDENITLYYSELAKKYGGSIKQQYQFGLVFYDGEIVKSELVTCDNLLVSKIQLPILKGYPLDSITTTILKSGETIYLNNLEKIESSSFVINYRSGLLNILNLKQKVILIDAIGTLYTDDENNIFEINKDLANYLSSLNTKVIVVTNAKGEIYSRLNEQLIDYNFDLFSLEFNPAKTDSSYYKILIEKYNLDLANTIYIVHSQDNLISAKVNNIYCFKFENNIQVINLIEDFVKGVKIVPEIDLPVILPDDVEFTPTGRSPLIDHKAFHQEAEKLYGEGFKREVDTMDTFVCSSWYFFRFCDPKNEFEFASPESLKNWAPVDEYIIGAEHIVLHLLYSRFFTKVLYDEGLINFTEPFKKMKHQGLILGPDQRKMSKRWGNVINPSDVIEEYGADTIRMYIMFMGPFEQAKPWNTNTVKGVKRFIDRVWKLQSLLTKENNDNADAENIYITYNINKINKIESSLQKLIKKIEDDIVNYSFNTSVSEFMKFVNLIEEFGCISIDQYKRFLIVLSPFAPFITDEMYSLIDSALIENKLESIHLEKYPIFYPERIIEVVEKLPVQINGKVRAEIDFVEGLNDEELYQKAIEVNQKWFENKEISFRKIVPNKMIIFGLK